MRFWLIDNRIKSHFETLECMDCEDWGKCLGILLVAAVAIAYWPITLAIVGLYVVYVLFLRDEEFDWSPYQPSDQKTFLDNSGYFRFTDSNMLVHRWVAEKKIGRKLGLGEVVHHRNGNKWDNRESNLEVMTWDEHERHHEEYRRQKGLRWYDDY